MARRCAIAHVFLRVEWLKMCVSFLSGTLVAASRSRAPLYACAFVGGPANWAISHLIYPSLVLHTYSSKPPLPPSHHTSLSTLLSTPVPPPFRSSLVMNSFRAENPGADGPSPPPCLGEDGSCESELPALLHVTPALTKRHAIVQLQTHAAQARRQTTPHRHARLHCTHMRQDVRRRIEMVRLCLDILFLFSNSLPSCVSCLVPT